MILPGSFGTAVLDTCVLAPMPLCDTLLRLAEEPAFYEPKWSSDILRELRSALRRMGYTSAQAERRIAAMEAAFEDACVTGYEALIGAMGNEPKDRHVLAAAVRRGADAIITLNRKHFPPAAVRPFSIEVLTPDEFLLRHHHWNRRLLLEKLEIQAAARDVPLAGLLDRLERFAPSCVRLLR